MLSLPYAQYSPTCLARFAASSECASRTFVFIRNLHCLILFPAYLYFLSFDRNRKCYFITHILYFLISSFTIFISPFCVSAFPLNAAITRSSIVPFVTM